MTTAGRREGRKTKPAVPLFTNPSLPQGRGRGEGSVSNPFAFADIRRAYLIVFLASFGGMTLELTASRVLAVSLGVSLYTWTGIIGVMLAGTAAGNLLGGLLADWANRPGTGPEPAGRPVRDAAVGRRGGLPGAGRPVGVHPARAVRRVGAGAAGTGDHLLALLPADGVARDGLPPGHPAGRPGRRPRRPGGRPGVRLEHGRGDRRDVRRRVRPCCPPSGPTGRCWPSPWC